MNENFVIELGDAKDETKAPHPLGCQQDGTTPIRYSKRPEECGG